MRTALPSSKHESVKLSVELLLLFKGQGPGHRKHEQLKQLHEHSHQKRDMEPVPNFC